MSDEELLSEIRKECEDYIKSKIGIKDLTGTVREDHFALKFILLRIAKLEKRLTTK